MSTSACTNTNSGFVPTTIATQELRLNTRFSTGLKSEGKSDVFQTIEVLCVADNDDVARVKGTPYYYRDDHSSNDDIVTLSPTEQRVKVHFGSTAVPTRHDPRKFDIKAYADVPGLGRLSKSVTNMSSIADNYRPGDRLGGDYESLTSDFVSLVWSINGQPLTPSSGQARGSQWVQWPKNGPQKGSGSLCRCEASRSILTPFTSREMVPGDYYRMLSKALVVTAKIRRESLCMYYIQNVLCRPH